MNNYFNVFVNREKAYNKKKIFQSNRLSKVHLKYLKTILDEMERIFDKKINEQ